TYEYGPTSRRDVLNFVCHSLVFADFSLEYQVAVVLSDHGLVGRNHHNRQAVDSVELFALGLGRTGHTGELVVHAEVVLEGDCRHGHVLAANLYGFLGFDRLVETFAVPTPVHHAAGEFVDNHDVTIANDVVLVTVINGL